ncbi:integrase [Klebsiella quasipneumoniae]|nr:integrase [Klebsiella quasipneumoniae]
MTVKHLEDGRYKVDIRPNGVMGRRVQRIFNKKADAIAFERYVIGNMHNKEWLEKSTDHRRLSELLDRWWVLYGRSQRYGGKRLRELRRVISDMEDPRVSKISKGLSRNTEASVDMTVLKPLRLIVISVHCGVYFAS